MNKTLIKEKHTTKTTTILADFYKKSIKMLDMSLKKVQKEVEARKERNNIKN